MLSGNFDDLAILFAVADSEVFVYGADAFSEKDRLDCEETPLFFDIDGSTGTIRLAGIDAAVEALPFEWQMGRNGEVEVFLST